MMATKPGYNELLQKPETKMVDVIDEDSFVS